MSGICEDDFLSLQTKSEPGPELEDCPFCQTPIRPGAIVCAACRAFKDRRVGCTGCLVLFGAVGFTIGVLAVAAMFPTYGDAVGIGAFLLRVWSMLASLPYVTGHLPESVVRDGIAECRPSFQAA